MKPGRTRIGLAAATLFAASLAGAQQGAIDVIVNGQPVLFRGAGPQTVNGRVLVPLRGVLEKLGAYVDWEPVGQLVTATRGDIDLQLRIGDRSARVNGRPVVLDVPAMIFRGSTLVPLRFVSEALGAQVTWDARQYAVLINTQAIETGGVRTQDVPDRAADLRISSFEVEPEGWLRPGTVVHFTLIGTPGGRAYVLVPGVTREIEMVETRAGEYAARWTVPDTAGRDDALNVSRANAIARLRIGDRERHVQSPDSLTLDNANPLIRSFFPEHDSRVTNNRPMISAVLDDGTGSGVDPRTVRVRIGGQDVTEDATVTENFVSYRPTRALAGGEHEITITARDYAGNASTRSWVFRVDDRGDRVVRSLEVTGAQGAMPGDVIRLTLNAEPGGYATFSIGDQVRDIRMDEQQEGWYVGSYTVRRGDNFMRDAITARFVSRSGAVYTVQPTSAFEVSGGPLEAPRITTPIEGVNVRTPLVVEGRTTPNARVLIRVDYSTDVTGGVRLKGTVGEFIVVADETGRFRSQPIALDPLVQGGNTRFTIAARTLGSGGTRSEETLVTVLR